MGGPAQEDLHLHVGAPWSRVLWRVAVPTALVFLAACGANMRAAIGTAGQALDGGKSVADQVNRLDPQLDYLRVQIGRQTGLMVRAEAEWTVHGRTELWFSADGALMRLANGRVVGFSEGSRSWQVTRTSSAVDWHAAGAGQPQLVRWSIDQQPGYRIGLRSDRVLERSPVGPADHPLDALLLGTLTWFVERDGQHPSDLSWYAVDLNKRPARVLYAKTCLTPEWCLSWQSWPPKVQP